ncbi:hypothetical protein PR048_033401 [Dryococelus australis]|uniref:Uncharacterized protein n=1 Tax=Dryococelus australis TaxID=614101 RepID=A0ABQ9G141_9NEOP|nr:hypothetical protein PR048_033401 [Dryococelus australis]
MWESCRMMPLVGRGFLGDLPFPSSSHSGATPYSPRFILIGSQDPNIKSRPDISILLSISFNLTLYAGRARLLTSHQRRTGFGSQPTSLPDFRTWGSCRTIPLCPRVVSGISRFLLPLRSGAAPYLPRFTLIVSQDSAVRAAQISPLHSVPISSQLHRVSAEGETLYRHAHKNRHCIGTPPMRAIEVRMEQRRNEMEGVNGGSLRKPARQSGVARYGSHVRKFESDPAGDWARFTLVGGEQVNRSATATPL